MKQAYECAALIILGIVLGTVGAWFLVNTIKHIDQQVSSTLSAK